MATSLPVAALTVMSVLLVTIGLFVAGSLEFTGLGIAGLVAAALFQTLAGRRP